MICEEEEEEEEELKKTVGSLTSFSEKEKERKTQRWLGAKESAAPFSYLIATTSHHTTAIYHIGQMERGTVLILPLQYTSTVTVTSRLGRSSDEMATDDRRHKVLFLLSYMNLVYKSFVRI